MTKKPLTSPSSRTEHLCIVAIHETAATTQLNDSMNLRATPAEKMNPRPDRFHVSCFHDGLALRQAAPKPDTRDCAAAACSDDAWRSGCSTRTEGKRGPREVNK